MVETYTLCEGLRHIKEAKDKMENFIHEIFSKHALIAFTACNLAPCLLFAVPFLLVRRLYPKQRSKFERNIISLFFGTFFLGLFLYPTPSAFRVIAVINLSFLLLLLFIIMVYKHYPYSNKGERIFNHFYLICVPVIALLLVVRFYYLSFLQSPASLEGSLIPGFFAQLSFISFILLLPVVGTLWLLKDARKRRQKTRMIIDKAKNFKK